MVDGSKRFIVKWYKPKKLFWVVRLNLFYDREIKIGEFTIGLLGYGLLIFVRFKPLIKVPDAK